jgi:plastocyanin
MLKRLLLVLLALAQAAPGPSANTPRPAPAGGTIRGAVVVVKNGAAQKADSWVYLQDVTKHRPHSDLPGVGVTAEIRQKGEQFVPHVVVVPAGAVVAFPNFDDKEHNVFSPTDPPGQWDLGRYNTDHKGKTHEFDVADEIDIYCDIHREMWAKVKVVDTTYYAQVMNGKFELANVRPGRYKVVAWAPNSGEVKSATVEIAAAGDVVTLPADLHLEAGEVAAHHRKDGSSYGLYKP